MTTTGEQLISELSALLGDVDPREAVVAFDGDGTLWSGDVGEDLFHAALGEGFLLDAARPALLAEAERYAVPLAGAEEANTIAHRLFAAYLAGLYPERETCAMMTWCYAGRALSEVEELARRVLDEHRLDERLHAELSPIVSWARERGVRTVLVSASPRAVVEAAAAFWSFAPQDVTAATPALEGARILPRMAAPVPYAENKLSAGRALFGSARWLAAFGDNVFDIEMLKGAELGVAVRPKPKLEQQLATLGLRRLARVD